MSLLGLLLRRSAALSGHAPAVPADARPAPEAGDARDRADEPRQGPPTDAAPPDEAAREPQA